MAKFANALNVEVGEFVPSVRSEYVICRRTGRSFPATFTRTLPDSSENYALTEFHWAWFCGSRRNTRNWPEPVLAAGDTPNAGRPKYPLAGDDSAFTLKRSPQYPLAPVEMESKGSVPLAEG